MTTRQGDLSLLNDPVAQQLFASKLPAQLAYNWTDGTPRVVPIWFHWNGRELVFGTPPDAPKMHALHDGDAVAITINSVDMPYKILLLRGTVRLDEVAGIAPEYEASTYRVLGDDGGAAWIANVRPMCPRMARIFVEPNWVGVQDFEQRFPNAIERAMEQAMAAGGPPQSATA
jgi:hypothetical protein